MADLEFLERGFQYAIKVHVALLLEGSGGTLPYRQILRSFLMYSCGGIAKVGQRTAKPSCCV